MMLPCETEEHFGASPQSSLKVTFSVASLSRQCRECKHCPLRQHRVRPANGPKTHHCIQYWDIRGGMKTPPFTSQRLWIIICSCRIHPELDQTSIRRSRMSPQPSKSSGKVRTLRKRDLSRPRVSRSFPEALRRMSQAVSKNGPNTFFDGIHRRSIVDWEGPSEQHTDSLTTDITLRLSNW